MNQTTDQWAEVTRNFLPFLLSHNELQRFANDLNRSANGGQRSAFICTTQASPRASGA